MPERSKLEYAIRFGFKVTNNEVEYEAMITGLCLAHTLGARRVKVQQRLPVGCRISTWGVWGEG